MRNLFLATGLIGLVALFGCAGDSAPIAPLSSDATLANLMEEMDSAPVKTGIMEIYDAETGALVLKSDLDVDADGSFNLGLRGAQDTTQGPISANGFRLALVIDEDGPTGHVPRGYSPAGNPLYYYGDTLHYDTSITSEFPERERLLSMIGSFDMIVEHCFASSGNQIPVCPGMIGQNPLVIPEIDFMTETPNNPPNYNWSFTGDTFTVGDAQFKLCGGAGSQPGTDLICVKIEWVFSGALLGLSCDLCEIHCTVFDETVGIYDP